MTSPSGERGSVSIELVLLAPALLLLLSFAVVAGRTQIAESAVAEAARAAAREASLARSSDAAVAAAGAEQALRDQDLHCQSMTVKIDTAGFQAPPSQPADVTVTVSCVVGMADLLAPGLPGSVTVEASFTSPIDAFRER